MKLWSVTCLLALDSLSTTITFAFQSSSLSSLVPKASSSKPHFRLIVPHAAQTGDDFRGPPNGPPGPPNGNTDPRGTQAAMEANRVRQAYMDWCQNYGKEFDENRLPIFAENLLRMEKYTEQTGERVRFNEFADLTTDEYRYLLMTRQAQRNAIQQQRQQQQQLEPPEWQQAAPTKWQQKVQETNPKGYETMLGLSVYFQTAFVGVVIGSLCVLPVTAFHYLYWEDYVYTTYAQWEWDMIVSAIQASVFATVYRYGIRRELDNTKLSSRIIASFVLVRALLRVTVTPDCAAYTWLYCAEPYYLLNDSMVATLFINFLESIALFVPVAKVMKSLLEQDKIPPYDGYDA